MRILAIIVFILSGTIAGCRKEMELRESMLFTLSVRDRFDNDLLDTSYVGHFSWNSIQWKDSEDAPVEFRISRKYGAFLLENIGKLRDNTEYKIFFPNVPVQSVRFEFEDYVMTDRQSHRDIKIRSISRVLWNGEPLEVGQGYFIVKINL